MNDLKSFQTMLSFQQMLYLHFRFFPSLQLFALPMRYRLVLDRSPFSTLLIDLVLVLPVDSTKIWKAFPCLLFAT